MSELIPPVKSTALTKRQARALEKSDYIRYLQAADLSDARRYFELARCAMRQHDKAELIAGAVVGTIAAIFLGGGTLLGTLFAGLGVFIGTLFVIFLIHWLRSPGAFHKAAIAQRDSALARLEETQVTGPKLMGWIYCLTLDVHHHPSEPEGLYGDCWFTMSVNVWNDGVTATSITGFRFRLKWTGSEDDWPARQVEGLDRFRAKSVRLSDPGSNERYAEEIENLFDFPVPTEITTTNNQRGWLRFVVRDFPLNSDKSLDRDTEITLVGLDKRGDPHSLYQGSIASIGTCPPIEALPMRSQSQLEIKYNEQRAGYIDQTSVLMRGQISQCTLYRISVTYHGTKSTVASLKAEEVTLTDGRRYPPLHLRLTGRSDAEKQVRLNPGTPIFWDVMEKENSDRDWVMLRHTERMGEILLRTSATFLVTASCDDDLPITKAVKLEVRDDGGLNFQLLDV